MTFSSKFSRERQTIGGSPSAYTHSVSKAAHFSCRKGICSSFPSSPDFRIVSVALSSTYRWAEQKQSAPRRHESATKASSYNMGSGCWHLTWLNIVPADFSCLIFLSKSSCGTIVTRVGAIYRCAKFLFRSLRADFYGYLPIKRQIVLGLDLPLGSDSPAVRTESSPIRVSPVR